jgi:excisionase family DNA binding protein
MATHDATLPDGTPYLKSRRVAAYAGVSLRTIDRAIAAGKLPVAGRVGGNGERVFRRDDVEAWLLGRTRRDDSDASVAGESAAQGGAR